MFCWIWPVARPSGWASPASMGASSGRFGRPCVESGSQAWVSHATTSPPSPTAARRSRSWGGPFGSQPCSSSRIHWTRTGRPTARERSAASQAASSAPFWP